MINGFSTFCRSDCVLVMALFTTSLFELDQTRSQNPEQSLIFHPSLRSQWVGRISHCRAELKLRCKLPWHPPSRWWCDPCSQSTERDVMALVDEWELFVAQEQSLYQMADGRGKQQLRTMWASPMRLEHDLADAATPNPVMKWLTLDTFVGYTVLSIRSQGFPTNKNKSTGYVAFCIS